MHFKQHVQSFSTKNGLILIKGHRKKIASAVLFYKWLWRMKCIIDFQGAGCNNAAGIEGGNLNSTNRETPTTIRKESTSRSNKLAVLPPIVTDANTPLETRRWQGQGRSNTIFPVQGNSFFCSRKDLFFLFRTILLHIPKRWHGEGTRHAPTRRCKIFAFVSSLADTLNEERFL